jgi:hypothetical protein
MSTAALIGLLLSLIEAAPKLVETISRLMEQAHRDGEMTADEVAALRARMDVAFAKPHWQIEREGGG